MATLKLQRLRSERLIGDWWQSQQRTLACLNTSLSMENHTEQHGNEGKALPKQLIGVDKSIDRRAFGRGQRLAEQGRSVVGTQPAIPSISWPSVLWSHPPSIRLYACLSLCPSHCRQLAYGLFCGSGMRQENANNVTFSTSQLLMRGCLLMRIEVFVCLLGGS